MIHRTVAFAAAAAACLSVAGGASGQSAVAPTNDLPNPFQTVENYFKLPAGRTWGSTSAIDVDKDGTSIWIAERCGSNSCAGSTLDPILKFDASGALVQSFGAGLFLFPHGIHVDCDGNIWVTDGQGPDGKDPRRDGKGHTVVKFSPEGKVLMTLGKAGVKGAPPDALDEPNDVITMPNGDILVAKGTADRMLTRPQAPRRVCPDSRKTASSSRRSGNWDPVPASSGRRTAWPWTRVAGCSSPTGAMCGSRSSIRT